MIKKKLVGILVLVTVVVTLVLALKSNDPIDQSVNPIDLTGQELIEYLSTKTPDVTSDRYRGYIYEKTLIVQDNLTDSVTKIDTDIYLRDIIEPNMPDEIKGGYKIIDLRFIDGLELIEAEVEDAINHGSRNPTTLILWSNIDGSNVELIAQVTNGTTFNFSEDYSKFALNTFGVSGQCIVKYIYAYKSSDPTESVLIDLGIESQSEALDHVYSFSQWIDNSSFEFNVEINNTGSCLVIGNDTQDIETWQYNVETGEYTLVE